MPRCRRCSEEISWSEWYKWDGVCDLCMGWSSFLAVSSSRAASDEGRDLQDVQWHSEEWPRNYFGED